MHSLHAIQHRYQPCHQGGHLRSLQLLTYVMMSHAVYLGNFSILMRHRWDVVRQDGGALTFCLTAAVRSVVSR